MKIEIDENEKKVLLDLIDKGFKIYKKNSNYQSLYELLYNLLGKLEAKK